MSHGNIVYTTNDFCRTLRIPVAGMIALSVSTFYNMQYGVSFVVYPLVSPPPVPVFNCHVATQFVFSAAVNYVEMVLIVDYFSQWSLAMTLVVSGLYVMRLRFMSEDPLFLLGSMDVVCQSTMLNFMSYSTINWHTLMLFNIEACVMAVALSALLHYLIPDVKPCQSPSRIEKDVVWARHESLLSGTVTATIFAVFRTCDLSDSLSALMAGTLILFSMHYRGVVISSIWRVIDVVLARLHIPLVRLLTYDFSNHMLSMTPLIGLGLAFSVHLHVMEEVRVDVGFASITVIGIMFGRSLHPDQDLVSSDLYRTTPITFALMATLTMVFLVCRVLNYLVVTRFVITE